jgi:hypothetical protein
MLFLVTAGDTGEMSYVLDYCERFLVIAVRRQEDAGVTLTRLDGARTGIALPLLA